MKEIISLFACCISLSAYAALVGSATKGSSASEIQACSEAKDSARAQMQANRAIEADSKKTVQESISGCSCSEIKSPMPYKYMCTVDWSISVSG